MIAEEALAIAKSYTKKSLEEQGALKGDKGDKGEKGDTYTPVIGNVTTVDNLVNASASIELDESTLKAKINLSIPKGANGDKGDKGDTGEKGTDGVDGYSPTVVENANNTEDNYKLDITTKTTSYTTPNLKGKQGIQGLQGIQGEAGKDGTDGTTYTPSIGEVTTVDSTELASATVSVNTETKEAVFNFAIPKGNKGLDGKDGVQINDSSTNSTSTWSSSKINSKLGGLTFSASGTTLSITDGTNTWTLEANS